MLAGFRSGPAATYLRTVQNKSWNGDKLYAEKLYRLKQLQQRRDTISEGCKR